MAQPGSIAGPEGRLKFGPKIRDYSSVPARGQFPPMGVPCLFVQSPNHEGRAVRLEAPALSLG